MPPNRHIRAGRIGGSQRTPAKAAASRANLAKANPHTYDLGKLCAICEAPISDRNHSGLCRACYQAEYKRKH